MKNHEQIVYLMEFFEKTFFHSFIFKVIGGAIFTTSSFLLPIQGFIYLTASLVTADFITGIIASKKRKEKIRADKMINTIYKLIAYSIALIISEGLKIVLLPEIEVAYFATFYIAATELQSLDENIEHITGISMFSSIIKKFKSITEKKNKNNE